MKTLPFLLVALFPFPCLLVGQAVDSSAMQQVDSLIQVSRKLTTAGSFEKALEINAAAEHIALDKIGRISAAYASCCFNRGRVNSLGGNFLESEKWYLESKKTWEALSGKEHPEYALCLNNLGVLYKKMGAFEKAEAAQLESKTIRKKTVGQENLDYAQSLYNLGLLYIDMGRFEEAEDHLLVGANIRKKLSGPESADYLACRNALADAQLAMGDYEKAEVSYLEIKTAREKTVGKEHRTYAATLNNLAALYQFMGNYEASERLFLEALAIRTKNPGANRQDYAQSLNNLSAFYQVTGQYEKAEPFLLESLAERAKEPGKESVEYAMCLTNLAALHENMGQAHDSEAMYLQAGDIFEKKIGRAHPTFALNLFNLALLYQKMGDLQKSEHLHLEAKAIREKAIGKQSLGYFQSLHELSSLFEAQGRSSDSEAVVAEMLAFQQHRLSNSVSFLSEKELANYAAAFHEVEDDLPSFAFNRLTRRAASGNLSALNFDHALFQKGFLLSATQKLNRLARSSPEAAKLYHELIGYRRQLAAEFAKPAAERRDVLGLEEKSAALEKDIARLVAGYAETARQITWKDVQANLKASELAVEFVRFRVRFPQKSDSTIYAALLLAPGDTAPAFVPLFEERQLSALIKGASGSNFRGINQIYAAASTGKKLHELIWKPLESQLSAAKAIYFSPTGLLHRLNLGAIRGAAEKVFGEQKKLVALGSTRQLVPNANYQPPANLRATAAILGGIRYETDSIRLPAPPVLSGIRGAAERNTFYMDTMLHGSVGAWDFLPGSAQEAAEIQKILLENRYQTQLDTAFSATEENFRALAQGKDSPRVLHLATHGFFYPDPQTPAANRSLSFGQENQSFRLSDNPMMRAGLILAGANRAWATGRGLANREDGILTAYEIGQLDFSGTELAVLSACETGLGDIAGNEGVYGLQRAFKIAGVKYLMMSLWKVSDVSTREFMAEFYRQWLSAKRTVPDAFRAAQRNLRAKYPDSPYNWAGFVLIE